MNRCKSKHQPPRGRRRRSEGKIVEYFFLQGKQRASAGAGLFGRLWREKEVDRLGDMPGKRLTQKTELWLVANFFVGGVGVVWCEEERYVSCGRQKRGQACFCRPGSHRPSFGPRGGDVEGDRQTIPNIGLLGWPS
ncbi:hypothetical protein M406DRAFT_102594 [Cryphonectria parasitica EP155]|uniref:Uncharacterized protein n=1 Tax=Cryphonectria parasitica (strain ATCC 38755 / EP155) TaxID=660469 RepID=A0A9P5CMP9_CRYP1|nr:uncharacterized protein M406DRAFT_102594 [Cryphonectria parasitica EP155]KAF3764343.1 hypothetical protein M406DRAFT_102594 [Cryphonectria parasitica EP155]